MLVRYGPLSQCYTSFHTSRSRPGWGTTEDEKPCLGPLASGRRDWPAGRRRSQGPNAAAQFSWQSMDVVTKGLLTNDPMTKQPNDPMGCPSLFCAAPGLPNEFGVTCEIGRTH